MSKKKQLKPNWMQRVWCGERKNMNKKQQKKKHSHLGAKYREWSAAQKPTTINSIKLKSLRHQIAKSTICAIETTIHTDSAHRICLRHINILYDSFFLLCEFVVIPSTITNEFESFAICSSSFEFCAPIRFAMCHLLLLSGGRAPTSYHMSSFLSISFYR